MWCTRLLHILPGTPLKRYCTGSAQENGTGCECVTTMRKLYFSKAKSSVWKQAEADQKTCLGGGTTNYPVKLLCTSLHILYYCRYTSCGGGTAGIVTRPQACLIPSAGKRFFSTPNHSDWLWDPHSLIFSGYWALLLTPTCRAPITNEWSYTSASPCVRDMHGDYFNFLSVRIVMDRWNTNMVILEPVIS
jgi:hypothetical protein